MCVRDKYLAALSAYAVLITAVHVFRPGGESFMPAASAAADLASVSIAVILGVSAVRYFRLSTRQGKSMALLTAGLLMWLLSETLWVTTVRGSAGVLTDLTFILAYPFLIGGIFYGYRTLDVGFRKEMLLMPALVALLLTWAVGMALLSNQNIAGASLANTLLIYAYSISDTVLLIPAVLLVRRAFSGFFSRPWMMIRRRHRAERRRTGPHSQRVRHVQRGDADRHPCLLILPCIRRRVRHVRARHEDVSGRRQGRQA